MFPLIRYISNPVPAKKSKMCRESYELPTLALRRGDERGVENIPSSEASIEQVSLMMLFPYRTSVKIQRHATHGHVLSLSFFFYPRIEE